MKRIVVYGLLREGMPLWERYLKGRARFLGRTRVKGYDMYALSYPWAVKGYGEIVVEIFDVPDEIFEVVDEIERSAGYERTRVVVPGFGEAYMWLAHYDIVPENAKRVEHGDFVKWIIEEGDVNV